MRLEVSEPCPSSVLSDYLVASQLEKRRRRCACGVSLQSPRKRLVAPIDLATEKVRSSCSLVRTRARKIRTIFVDTFNLVNIDDLPHEAGLSAESKLDGLVLSSRHLKATTTPGRSNLNMLNAVERGRDVS